MTGANPQPVTNPARRNTEGSTLPGALLEHSPHAVLFVSPDWKIAYANDSAVRLGQSADIVGQDLWEALSELAGPEPIAECSRAMEKRIEVEFERKFSENRWLQVCVRAHENGIALYCRDITKLKLTEEALQEGEVELRDFFEKGNVALHWVGPDGVIMWANEAELAMVGYTAAEYVGRNIRDFHVDKAVIDDMLARLASNQSLHQYESRLRRKDGTIVHVAISSSVYRKHGRFVHTRCFTRDITEERILAVSQARLAAIIDSSDDAIISKDLNGVITSWNQSAHRLFGYTAEEAIGQSVAKLLIPDDRQNEEPHILSRLRAGERVDHFQTKRRCKDGTLLDISLTISPIKDAHGRIVGASKIARDITAPVRNQEALTRANERLQESNADLEQFAYSASHDLQEPLRMVSAYGQLLHKKYAHQLDETAQEYIEYVVDGAVRMERLLRDLRAFTRVSLATEGRAPAVDAGVVLTSAIANLKASIEENDAVITADPLPRVRIPEAHLELLLQNILANAIRYRTAAPPRIHVGAAPEGQDWNFSLQDNGIGIDPEYKETIFGIFTRLHTSAEYPGTGMGLAICHRIVQRAGGRIWVESEPGRGSTFFFVLPGERGGTRDPQVTPPHSPSGG